MVDLVGGALPSSLLCFRFFVGGVTKGSPSRSSMLVLVLNRTMAPSTPGLLGTVPLILFFGTGTSDEPNTKAKMKPGQGIKSCLSWRIGNHTQNITRLSICKVTQLSTGPNAELQTHSGRYIQTKHPKR